MAVPSLTLPISALLGDAESQSTLLLSNFYSSGGSVNLYIDKLGQITGVGGWTKQNGSAKTTDTGASAAMWRALHMYRKVAAGAVTRQLILILDDQVNEQELYYSTDLGATFTFITDFGAGSINTIPDFAQFGTELYLTNGVITPRLWDGTSLTSTGVTQLAAPTLADGGAGGLNGAGYRYRLVPILAGQVRKPGSVASAALDVQNRRVTVSWTADADGSVVGYELYRTTGGGLDYYLVTYSDGRTVVSFSDSLSDADLLTRQSLSVVASHGDPPPVGAYFCVAHKQRVWWGRTDTYPRRWWISDPGDADSVYTDRMYVECSDALSMGDISTGGTGEYNGMIVLWCERSVWRVTGTGRIVGVELDWRRTRTDAKVGTVWHRTVVRVPDGAVFTDQEGKTQKTTGPTLGYLTPNKDIRLFDGFSDTIISFPKTETLKRLNTEHQRKSFAYEDAEHGMFVWVFPADTATEPSYSVAWNYLYGTWHEWTGTSFGHVVVAESSTVTNILLAGEAAVATGGYVYKLWSGDDRNGASITMTLMLKAILPPVVDGGPPDLTQEKRIEALHLLFAKDASPTSLSVGFLPHDAADADAAAFTRSAINATSRVRVPARQTASAANPGKFFHGVGFRAKITSTATTGPWTLKGLTVQYQVLGGMTR